MAPSDPVGDPRVGDSSIPNERRYHQRNGTSDWMCMQRAARSGSFPKLASGSMEPTNGLEPLTCSLREIGGFFPPRSTSVHKGMRGKGLRDGRIPRMSADGRRYPPPLLHRFCHTAVGCSARGGSDPLKDPGWVRWEVALTGRELSRASPMRFQTPPSEALAGPSTYPKTRVTVDQETGRRPIRRFGILRARLALCLLSPNAEFRLFQLLGIPP